MPNIVSNINCFGCGVCALVCPHKLISIELNVDGFYVPIIKSIDQCSQCGLCVKVCSYLDTHTPSNSFVKTSYAAYNKDAQIRKQASSGGVAYAIADSLVRLEYKICAVRYNYESHQAEHYIANTSEELIASLGSKYMQSYSLNGLENLSAFDKYVVIGTPCMIASMRKFIDLKHISNNFILIDFFCHGVPSKLLWNKYIKLKEKEIGKIHYISWRDKVEGWHNSYKMNIRGRRGTYVSGLKQGDIFFRLFLGDYCLNEACYSKCRFKMMNSAADIRIGDLWGKTYATNEEGYSGVLVYTSNGENALQESKNLELKVEEKCIITEGQMSHPPIKPYARYFIMRFLKQNRQNWWKEIMLIRINETCHKLIKVIIRPHIVIKNRLKWTNKKK